MSVHLPERVMDLLRAMDGADRDQHKGMILAMIRAERADAFDQASYLSKPRRQPFWYESLPSRFADLAAKEREVKP